MKNSYQVEPATTVQEQPVNNDLAKVKDITTSGNPFLIVLSLFSLYFIWGGTYLAMRIGLEGFPPFLMASVRFLIAGSLLYAVLRLRGAVAPTRAQWIGSAIIGTLLLVGGNGGVAFSEQWVASGLASVGIAAVPLWTALFAGLWGRWPTRIEWLGLGLGFIGVILLNLGNNMWANPAGAIALLIAAISWALGSVVSRHVSLPTGLMSSACEMLTGGIVLFLMSLGFHEKAPNLTVVPALLALGFLIIFGSLVAFSAYGYLLRHVRPTLATSYAYVNPLVAVVLGVVRAGERLTLLEILAIIIVLSGVVLVSLQQGKHKS